MSFDDDIRLSGIGPGVYACEISPEHWVVAGPNGGYLAALVTRAGDLHLGDPSRSLRSLTVHYLRPPRVGPARIEGSIEQLGRSVAFLRFTMIQGEKKILLATGAWAMARSGFEHGGWVAPEVRPPEACPELERVREGEALPIHRQWEIRSASDARFGSGGTPDLSWWVRPPIHRALDAPMLVAIADAFPPPIFVTSNGPMAVPTLDLTVHVRANLDRVPWAPGDWLLTRFSTRFASGGFLEEDGAIWTTQGHLIAHSRQLALSV
ncbi:MAG TPA: thioesterase family protein [Deltaproteobacteria bacterium]|nr:thioesterase family protein [Deltaproteobacteria bacterium]